MPNLKPIKTYGPTHPTLIGVFRNTAEECELHFCCIKAGYRSVTWNEGQPREETMAFRDENAD